MTVTEQILSTHSINSTHTSASACTQEASSKPCLYARGILSCILMCHTISTQTTREFLGVPWQNLLNTHVLLHASVKFKLSCMYRIIKSGERTYIFLKSTSYVCISYSRTYVKLYTYHGL